MNDKKLIIPPKVISIARCFDSYYAKGEIKIKDYFYDSFGVVEDITGCFRVTKKPVSEDFVARFFLNNDTFSGFRSIKRIGIGKYINNDNNFNTSDYEVSSFNGLGLKKIINSSEFPHNILQNTTSSNIISVVGLFMNAAPETEYQNLVLPGDMFANCNKLENVSAIFFDLNNPYQLSGDEYSNFKTCIPLKNVSYAFAHSGHKLEPRTDPTLSGTIPLKFFYHGGTNRTIEARIGAESINTEYDDLGNAIVTPVGQVTVDKIVYKQPYATITNMEYCFMHSNLRYYRNTEINDYLEYNPNYAPYNYLYNSTTDTWTKNINRDDNQFTDI
jgi:hypothetical protein